ncbi:MAG: energy-coupling factor ABC transporter ATP-binding protein [Cyanobacteriota bacterium]
MNKIIEVKCFEHTYSDKTTVELCGIDFVVNAGEKVAILGPNGGGKTTLIKHILGLLKPNKQGLIKVFDIDPTTDFNKIRHKIGVVLQSVEEQLIGPTVLDDILFAPLNYNYPREEALKIANEAMELLDITHLKDKIIHYLSGGEKRKVALAGALVLKPELLVLDEPFSGLDVKSQVELVNIINNISNKNNITVVLTSHDVNLVYQFADTLYLISTNKMSQKGTPKEIFAQKELIESFNLYQPAILQLFSNLKEQGINLGSPISIEEAVEILKNTLKQHINIV